MGPILAKTLPPVLLAAALCAPGVAGPVAAPTEARLSSPVAGASQADAGDEAYQYLAGLCEWRLWSQAVREGRAFLERYPRHPRVDLARYRLGTALWELGRKDEAGREFAALAGLRGFEFAGEVAFRLGQAALEAGDAARAAEAFERALASDAEYLARPATFLLAEALFRQERWDDAERRYAALLEDDPRGEYAREAEHALVWCAFRAGRHEDAVRRARAFERAHADEPEAAEAVSEAAFLRGEALLAAGRAGDAVEAYRAGLAGPQADSAWRGLGFALSETGDHAGAARTFAELCRRHPESRHAAEAALHAGIELLRAGDPRAARAALEDRRVEPTADALYWLAQAQRQGGEAEAALATLERALRARPERELADRLQAARGDALSDLGRGEEALSAYREAGGDYGLYAAAVAALNAGRNEEALRLAGRLVADQPGSTYRDDALLVAGEALLALGRHEQAEQAFQRLLDSKPAEAMAARASARAAWCRYLSGDHAGAAERFEQTARRFPDAREAEEALYMAGLASEAAGEARAAARLWSRWLERHARGERRAEVLLGLARVEPGQRGTRRLAEALDAAPEGPAAQEALFRLGEALAQQGEVDEAASAYARLLAARPTGPFAHPARYALAWLRYEAGEITAASEVLEPLLSDREAPADLRLAARELSVWCAAKSGDVAGAARAWRELERECREDARTLEALKVALGPCREAADVETGTALLQHFLDRVRDEGLAADALVEATWLALDAGQPEPAEAAVRTALRVAPREALEGPRGAALAEAAFFVGEARYDAGDAAKASELYALAAPHAQGELAARIAYKRGFAALQQAEPVAAERAFAELVEEHPDSELHGEGLYLLGEARFQRGDWGGAVAPLDELVRLSPRHECVPKALLRLGVAQGELGAWRECEAALTSLLRRQRDLPQASEAQLWRGRALAARGDARGARSAFEAAVAADRGELGARARLELGHLARAAGDLEGALAEYLKVGVLYGHAPSVAEALCLAGECLEESGEREAASARYREVLQEHSDQPAAARARERLRALQGQ